MLTILCIERRRWDALWALQMAVDAAVVEIRKQRALSEFEHGGSDWERKKEGKNTRPG
jgi:hypothetical protein